MTSSQISAAGAYAQADRLVVSIPVRAIDPTRKRFEVEDQTAAEQAPVRERSEAESSDEQSASGGSQGRLTGGWSRAGFGLLGAFTSFLTRVFAQGETAAASTSAQAGIQAYTRAAGNAAANQAAGRAEVLSPSFPRLSSGRAIDLTV